MNVNLVTLASKLRDLLSRRQQRIVFVESCTGGWLAANMAAIPGISQWWCGSLVVYRCGSKHQWLDISSSVLEAPQIGPVSELVTIQLAQQALTHTSEADISIAVTGDIGPGVSAEKDGIVFCAMDKRSGGARKAQTRLLLPTPRDATDVAARAARLEEASKWVFECAIAWLESE